MATKFERYKQNHKLGQKYEGKADGKGGLIIPNEAMTTLRDGTVLFVDDIPYPFVIFEGKDYPIVKTSQGWTIGGAVAEAQHAKNVSAAK
jgi:hypothetical protein